VHGLAHLREREPDTRRPEPRAEAPEPQADVEDALGPEALERAVLERATQIAPEPQRIDAAREPEQDLPVVPRVGPGVEERRREASRLVHGEEMKDDVVVRPLER